MTLFSSIRVRTSPGNYIVLGRTPYILTGDEGLGMAPHSRYAQSGAQQHGETDRGFLLNPRSFYLFIGVEAYNEQDLWLFREELLSAFSPNRSLVLEVVIASPTALLFRNLDFFAVTSGLSFNSAGRTGTFQKEALQGYAPDPSFYDPTAEVFMIDLGGATPGMAVPTEVPTSIGESSNSLTRSLLYTGSWLSYPTITLQGPLEDVVITNETTGDVLDFTGSSFGTTETVTIVTRPGFRSVTNQNGDNLYSLLTSSSDLGTFHLEPPGDITPNGLNVLNVTSLTVDSNSSVTFTYYKRYLGI